VKRNEGKAGRRGKNPLEGSGGVTGYRVQEFWVRTVFQIREMHTVRVFKSAQIETLPQNLLSDEWSFHDKQAAGISGLHAEEG